MLVLGRARDQEVHIGDDIVVRVLRLGRKRVHLGIVAPAGVVVDRGEVRAAKAERDGERGEKEAMA